MSKRKRPQPHPPVKYSDLPGVLFPIDEYSVVEWNSDDHGVGPPEQVHILFPVKELNVTWVIRLKSRRAVDELIEILRMHADGVWPRD